jgi:hypothetical protein
MGYDTRFEGIFILDRPLTKEHKTVLEAFARIEHRPGEDGQPPYPECLYCQWEPTEDGTAIVWNRGEKSYCWLEWLEYLIQRFLKPWCYRLNGEVRWVGDGEINYLGRRVLDQGTIVVRDNVVETIDDPNAA